MRYRGWRVTNLSLDVRRAGGRASATVRCVLTRGWLRRRSRRVEEFVIVPCRYGEGDALVVDRLVQAACGRVVR